MAHYEGIWLRAAPPCVQHGKKTLPSRCRNSSVVVHLRLVGGVLIPAPVQKP